MRKKYLKERIEILEVENFNLSNQNINLISKKCTLEGHNKSLLQHIEIGYNSIKTIKQVLEFAAQTEDSKNQFKEYLKAIKKDLDESSEELKKSLVQIKKLAIAL